MKNLYQKILSKPESYRRRLAYGITAFLGIIVFAIWLSQTMITIKKTFRPSEEKNQTVEELKKSFPSLQTENMKLPENLLLEEDTQPAVSSETAETENPEAPASEETPPTKEINHLNIKGLELKTPEEEEKESAQPVDNTTPEE